MKFNVAMKFITKFKLIYIRGKVKVGAVGDPP